MTKREPQFNVRMSLELKNDIAKLAEKNNRSMNAEIIAALQAWVEAGSSATPAGSLKEITLMLEKLKSLVEKSIENKG